MAFPREAPGVCGAAGCWLQLPRRWARDRFTGKKGEKGQRRGSWWEGVGGAGWHALRAQRLLEKLMGRLSEGEGGKLARPPCRPSASGMLCLFTTSWKPDACFSWEITSSRATGGWQDVSREIFPPAHQLELLRDQGKAVGDAFGDRRKGARRWRWGPPSSPVRLNEHPLLPSFRF